MMDTADPSRDPRPHDLPHGPENPSHSHQRRRSLSASSAPEPHPSPPFIPKTFSSARATAGSRAERPPPILHQPRQPVKDAIDAVFDRSPSQNQLDPDLEKRLVEQVTEQVIKNLHLVNLAGATPTSSVHSNHPPSSNAPPSNASRSPPQQSPTRSSSESFPPHFTPPSPTRDRDGLERHSRGSSPGRDAPGSRGSARLGRRSEESMRSRASTHSHREESTPRASQADVIFNGLKRSKTTALGYDLSASDILPRRGDGNLTGASGISRRDSIGAFDIDGVSRSRTLPAKIDTPPAVVDEPTTLEQYWQPLFDNADNPTPRLGQFLRGLAKHIIDDYEPKYSLVVGPKKMLRFMEETKVDREHYPWSTIFGGKMCTDSISVMYRKLLCQHHFVQSQQQFQDAPSVPALTPHGFAQFMTCLIQAHPDTEYARLSTAVRDMPISNADDLRERFPKELSRRLLPKHANVQAEQRLIASLNHEADLVPLERVINAMPPPPSHAPPTMSPQQNAFQERERAPYSKSVPQSGEPDGDLDRISPPAMPIERERQPYFAKEGAGKQYESENKDRERERDRDRDRDRDRPRESIRPHLQYRSDLPPPRCSRKNSATQSVYSSGVGMDPVNAPPPARVHRMPPGPPPGAYSKNGRRSPPLKPAYRSEPDICQIPASQFASNLHGPSPRDRLPGGLDEEAPRPHDNSRRSTFGRSMVNEESGSRPGPPRNTPSTSNVFDSNAYPPGSVTEANPKRNSVPGPTEDRRRNWYAGTGAGSGTDGYGSYANGGGNNNYGPPPTMH